MDSIQTGNYAQIVLENVRIAGLKNSALVRSWGGDGKLICRGLTCGIVQENYLLAAEKPFECK